MHRTNNNRVVHSNSSPVQNIQRLFYIHTSFITPKQQQVRIHNT